jgi:RNA polymerase sigma-70 factor (ECF subfamily)
VPRALPYTENADPLELLAELSMRERTALVQVAVRAGLRAEEALECVQDALCDWLAQRGPEPAPEYEALVASLKVRVKNAARNRRRRHFHSKQHRELGEVLDLAAHGGDSEQLLDAAESSLRLNVCMAELRDVERAVVTLRLLEERSGEDVAEVLELSRAHVDVLVHRAKATLRVCMRGPDCGAV